MGMNLYYGGYGDYMEFTVAENEEIAVMQIGARINAPFLPVRAEKIDAVDGYEIRPVEKGAAIDAKPIAQPAPKTDTDAPVLRHCKQCDFTCENQGDLLRHYKTVHGKNKGD